MTILKAERKQRDDQTGFIFKPRGRVKHAEGWRRTMQRSFKRAVVRAGLDPKRVTPHVMRHTAITQLVQAGVDLPTIQRISGHKTLAMVLRYAHVSSAHIDAHGRVGPNNPGTGTRERERREHTGYTGITRARPRLVFGAARTL